MSSRDQARTSPGSDALGSALSVIGRRWLLIAGVLIACVGIGVYRYSKASKRYEATASVSFQSATLANSALGASSSGSGEPQREADTEVLVAHSSGSRPGRAPAAASSRRRRANARQKSRLKPHGTQTSSTSPRRRGRRDDSVLLANAFAQQGHRLQDARAAVRDRDRAEQARAAADRAAPAASPAAACCAGRHPLQHLNTDRALAGGGATVIGLAVAPTSPSGMGLSTTIVISLLVGLAIRVLARVPAARIAQTGD